MFRFGFACFLGNCSILQAELATIFRGLQVAIIRGYDKIIVESNSKDAFKMLHKWVSVGSPLGPPNWFYLEFGFLFNAIPMAAHI